MKLGFISINNPGRPDRLGQTVSSALTARHP